MKTPSVLFLLGFLKLNRNWILPLFGFPFLWRLIYLITGLERTWYTDISVDKTTLPLLLIPMALSLFLFSVAMGLAFKRKGPESWLSRLPVGRSVFSLGPVFLLGFFGCSLYLLSPSGWNYGAELSGFPIAYVLGVVPFFTYATVRGTQSTQLGLLLGVVACFVALGLGELLVEVANGQFGLLPKSAGLFLSSSFRSVLEISCINVILIFLLFSDDRIKERLSTLGVGILILGAMAVASGVRFYQEQEKLIEDLRPLDQIIATQGQLRSRCEHLKVVVRDYVANPGQPLQSREALLQVLKALKDSPKLHTDLKLLLSYYEKPSHNLAESLILERTFRIPGCSVIAGFDLQRAAIETLSKKPDLVTQDELRDARRVIWENLRTSSSSMGSVIQGMVNGNILELMVERGFIHSRYKLEILELNRDFEEGRRKIQQANVLYSFRMPSRERIHLIFEAMKKEIQFAEWMHQRLFKLVAQMNESWKE